LGYYCFTIGRNKITLTYYAKDEVVMFQYWFINLCDINNQRIDKYTKNFYNKLATTDKGTFAMMQTILMIDELEAENEE